MESFDQFCSAVLDLIALRRSRLDTLPLPAPDLQAELEDLEVEYQDLVDKTNRAEQEAIGEFYREALEEFGSSGELFFAYPHPAGPLLALQVEGARAETRRQRR